MRYETADAAGDWATLSSSTGIKENSTDLVLSIHCFHWIPEPQKVQSMTNISRMLKSGKYVTLSGQTNFDLIIEKRRW